MAISNGAISVTYTYKFKGKQELRKQHTVYNNINTNNTDKGDRNTKFFLMVNSTDSLQYNK